MSICETPDFMFPMMADVYYPITETTAYGNITKTWILDKTIVCSFNEAGVSYKEDIKPDPDIKTDLILLGRVKRYSCVKCGCKECSNKHSYNKHSG